MRACCWLPPSVFWAPGALSWAGVEAEAGAAVAGSAAFAEPDDWRFAAVAWPAGRAGPGRGVPPRQAAGPRRRSDGRLRGGDVWAGSCDEWRGWNDERRRTAGAACRPRRICRHWLRIRCRQCAQRTGRTRPHGQAGRTLGALELGAHKPLRRPAARHAVGAGGGQPAAGIGLPFKCFAVWNIVGIGPTIFTPATSSTHSDFFTIIN